MGFDPYSKNHKCLEYSGTNKKITAEENKRKFTILNNSIHEINKFKVDGCLITQGRKCDFLFVDCNSKESFFVELKGRHLSDAIDQIESTLDFFSNLLSSFNTVKARVVLSKVNSPDLRSSSYAKLLKKLKKINKSKLSTKDLFIQKTNLIKECV